MFLADPSLPVLPPSLNHLLAPEHWAVVTDGESGAHVWGSNSMFLKIQPVVTPDRPLKDEATRLTWLAERLPAPNVLGYDATQEAEFLVMTRLPGVPLHHPDALNHPERVVQVIAQAMRQLHALPVDDCPFESFMDSWLKQMKTRLLDKTVDVLTAQMMQKLKPLHTDSRDLVVTHGDPCLPNLLDNGDSPAGFIDVGRLGRGDRHADLSLVGWSLRRNLDQSWMDRFLDLYGRESIRPEKIKDYDECYAALANDQFR